MPASAPATKAPVLLRLPISSIDLLDNNPRKISKRDFKALCEDIRKDPGFLIQRPPLELDCWVEENVPEALQTDRMLKDNLHRGEWDFEKLMAFDPSFLQSTGFQFSELSEFFKEKDKVHNDNFNIEEELPRARKTTIVAGQIFQLGNHRLMCGTSASMIDVETMMGDDLADIVYCDPPYNIGLSYDKGVKPQTIKKRYTETVFSDNMANRDYTTWLMNIILNAKSVAKKNVHVFVWCDPKYIGIVQDAFRINGIVNKSVCFWVKNSFNPVTNMPFNRLVEPVVYGAIGKPTLNPEHKSIAEIFNQEITGRKIFETFMEIFDVWTVQRDHVNDYIHPTQKPVTLHEKPLKRCSFPGQIVIDLFGGSGSTLIACEQMERHARLMELDPNFCQLIINRWEKLTGKKAERIK